MREENTHPCEEGKKSHNLKKNRFRDILPCKFSVFYICFRALLSLPLFSVYIHTLIMTEGLGTERIISMKVYGQTMFRLMNSLLKSIEVRLLISFATD